MAPWPEASSSSAWTDRSAWDGALPEEAEEEKGGVLGVLGGGACSTSWSGTPQNKLSPGMQKEEELRITATVCVSTRSPLVLTVSPVPTATLLVLLGVWLSACSFP